MGVNETGGWNKLTPIWILIIIFIVAKCNPRSYQKGNFKKNYSLLSRPKFGKQHKNVLRMVQTYLLLFLAERKLSFKM